MSPISRVYAELIKKKRKKLKDVPEKIRKEVKELLKNEKVNIE